MRCWFKSSLKTIEKAGAIRSHFFNGSGDWIRTSDLVVNSHPLYR
jgi:hypothetical protein